MGFISWWGERQLRQGLKEGMLDVNLGRALFMVVKNEDRVPGLKTQFSIHKMRMITMVSTQGWF